MSVQGKTLNHSGDNGGRDPPVLIPNTEVKPACADGTWLDTTWESRTLPVPLKEDSNKLSSFFIYRRARIAARLPLDLRVALGVTRSSSQPKRQY